LIVKAELTVLSKQNQDPCLLKWNVDSLSTCRYLLV
jgi:hypothetical protein